MKKACLYVNHFFIKDEVFNESNAFLNRDNQLEPWRILKSRLLELGVDLRTQDFHPPTDSLFVLYMDMPAVLPRAQDVDKSYLMLFEPVIIKPDNYSRRKHRAFSKIFTWLKELTENDQRGKYIEIRTPQPLPEPRPKIGFAQRKHLCTLIAGGKLSLHPKELYSERIKWIRWFEKHHPSDFEFYGAGWDKMWMTGPLWIRAINKLPFWRKLFYGNFPSYKGKVERKLETLRQYRFSICLENARDIPGYVTEKIFDCFFAGNIPIYRGAPDIETLIPANCFIDLRRFNSYEEVYDLISGMSREEFESYQFNIECYLASESFQKFTSGRLVESILDHCRQRIV